MVVGWVHPWVGLGPKLPWLKWVGSEITMVEMGWVGSEITMVEMGWVGFSYQNLYIFRYYNQTDILLFNSDCSHLVFHAAVWI